MVLMIFSGQQFWSTYIQTNRCNAMCPAFLKGDIGKAKSSTSFGLKGTANIKIFKTGCGSLVVVLSLSIQEVGSSSPALACCVKPKAFKIGSDCSFTKSTAFRSENHGYFRYDLKNGGPMSQ
jgi:hypothetical protein